VVDVVSLESNLAVPGLSQVNFGSDKGGVVGGKVYEGIAEFEELTVLGFQLSLSCELGFRCSWTQQVCGGLTDAQGYFFLSVSTSGNADIISNHTPRSDASSKNTL